MSPRRNSTRPSSQARNGAGTVRQAVTGALALGVAALAVACAGDPTAPVAEPAAAPAQTLLSTTTAVLGTTVNGLLWATPAQQATVSRVIGPEGGTLILPGTAGLQLTVPARAVAAPTPFSITRRPGLIVAYDFQPHGTRFALPLTVAQPTAGTNFLRLPLGTLPQGAYFRDDAGLNAAAGTATVTEFQPTVVSLDRSWIRFTVTHFSGYMVSTGRTTTR